MSITKQLTREVISNFADKESNTGLSEVQIALFTNHIANLTSHMKINNKDYQARRGLLSFVTKRKRLLTYLKNKSNTRYEHLIKKLKLKSL